MINESFDAHSFSVLWSNVASQNQLGNIQTVKLDRKFLLEFIVRMCVQLF